MAKNHCYKLSLLCAKSLRLTCTFESGVSTFLMLLSEPSIVTAAVFSFCTFHFPTGLLIISKQSTKLIKKNNYRKIWKYNIILCSIIDNGN